MGTGARRLWILLVIAATLAVFGRALGHEFVIWDDNYHVTENPWLNPPAWSSLARFWRGPFLGMYVPASYTLFLLEAALTSKPDPAVFHVVNLALHAACAALVFVVLRRCVRSNLAACFGALLFALHPLQAESAAWVSETRGTLSALFGLIALERFLRSRERSAAREIAIGSLFFALALLAKPSAVAFVPIALVLHVLVLRRPVRASLAWLGPWTALALATIVLTKSLQADEGLKFVAPIAERPLIALDAFAFYLEKLALPIGLGPDYGRRPMLVVAAGPSALAPAAIALGLLVALSLATASLRRTLLPALAIFVAGVLPVLGLVPFVYQDVSTVADRYLYVALMGPALGLALALDRPPGRIALVAQASAAIVLAACAVLSFRQCGFWRDTETLFARALDVNPQSWIAHDNRGLALASRGDRSGARREYEASLAIKPDHIKAHNNLGLLCAQEGRIDEAIREFEAALASDPRYARAHTNLAIVLFRKGRLDEALEHAAQAVELSPDDAAAHGTLANVLATQNRLPEAIEAYESALVLRPRDADVHRNFAATLLRTGRTRAAIDHLESAIDARPDFADAELDLAWVLATAKNPALRDPARAVQISEVVRRSHPSPTVRMLDVLGAAYASAGRFDEAAQSVELAIEAARSREPSRIRELEGRLQLYRARKAVHEAAGGG